MQAHSWRKRKCMEDYIFLIKLLILFNRNVVGLNLEEIKGFKVPPKMLEKIRNHMRSKLWLPRNLNYANLY